MFLRPSRPRRGCADRSPAGCRCSSRHGTRRLPGLPSRPLTATPGMPSLVAVASTKSASWRGDIRISYALIGAFRVAETCTMYKLSLAPDLYTVQVQDRFPILFAMPRDTLNREQVVNAAIDLLDSEGLEGLNMRAL